MRIARITVWALDLPLAHPYWLSGGRIKVEKLDSTFVRLDTDEGISGWGEGCPWGHSYLPAHGPGLRAGIGVMAPSILGRDPCALDTINRVMDTTLPGHAYVKSPIDIACWDIFGKATGLPVWRLMGSESPATVPVNSSIPTGSPEEMVERIIEARVAGYRMHSAKIGGMDSALDIARIQAIEAALNADEAITFDVNRAWTPALAVQTLNAVTTRGWIEQPCETLEQCAHVARRIGQPIMLDECLHSFVDHLDAWRQRACEGVKVKPNRVGGLTRARQIRDFGIAVGWRMHIEDTGGTAFADTAAIHLAASTPAENRLPSWLGHAHLATDPLAGRGVRNVDGAVTPSHAPGFDLSPDPERLGEPIAVYGTAP